MSRRSIAQGEDLGGSQIRSRFERREDRLRQVKADAKMSTRGAEPAPDKAAHGLTAHIGTHGAPSVYRESPGGRRGGRGKRMGY